LLSECAPSRMHLLSYKLYSPVLVHTHTNLHKEKARRRRRSRCTALARFRSLSTCARRAEHIVLAAAGASAAACSAAAAARLHVQRASAVEPANVKEAWPAPCLGCRARAPRPHAVSMITIGPHMVSTSAMPRCHSLSRRSPAAR
jgi:hypothetical protein